MFLCNNDFILIPITATAKPTGRMATYSDITNFNNFTLTSVDYLGTRKIGRSDLTNFSYCTLTYVGYLGQEESERILL